MIFYITGPTCSGKSVLVDAAKAKYGNRVGVIQVGLMLRAKYPAGHFQGQANPANTAAEAMAMYHQSLQTVMAEPEVELILVDGQPRQDQIHEMLHSYPELVPRRFLHLHASAIERRKRIGQRFPQGTDDYLLALKRIDNDQITYYQTFVQMLSLGVKISVLCTDPPKDVWVPMALQWIDFCLKNPNANIPSVC